jgi:hypothetical protein
LHAAILAVVGGKVYAVRLGSLIRIDVATGKAEELCQGLRSHCCDGGRLYAAVSVEGHLVLRVFDFRKGVQRDVCLLEDRVISFPPLNVSPDHSTLAFYRPCPEQAGRPRTSQLHLVDFITGGDVAVGPAVPAAVFPNGFAEVANGPPFVWLDANRILYASDEQRVGQDHGDGRSRMRLATVNVHTGKVTSWLETPFFRRVPGTPCLEAPQGGAPRIVLGELGAFRIDFQNRRLVEDDAIGGAYAWQCGRLPEQLLFDKTLLARAGKDLPAGQTGPLWPAAPDVLQGLSVAPDGRAIVWRQPLTELHYHDSRSRVIRTVARGWLARPPFTSEHPAAGRPGQWGVTWATARDLEPALGLEVPGGWSRFDLQPWPPPPTPQLRDERADLASALTLELATDRPAYRHHEPVKVRVVVKNRSKFDVTLGGAAGENVGLMLTYRSPRSSGWLRCLRDPLQVLPNPLAIKAGASFQKELTEEPYEPGPYTLEGELWVTGQVWKGRVQARPVTVPIAKGKDDARLLKAKFDRLLALCRKEYDQDPATVDHARLWQLGPAAVPHLVAVLEGNDEAGFRRRLASALVPIADAEALPYLEKRLRGELKEERGIVLYGLFGMYERSVVPDRALGLLVSALRHREPEVRRDTAALLKKVRDGRVRVAFEAAVGDADPAVALTAARYLAAGEGVNLAEWLRRAAGQPTRARLVAARWVVGELEQTWGETKGDVPPGAWEAVAADPARRAAYVRVLEAWARWAREHPRYEAQFFEAQRRQWLNGA